MSVFKIREPTSAACGNEKGVERQTWHHRYTKVVQGQPWATCLACEAAVGPHGSDRPVTHTRVTFSVAWLPVRIQKYHVSPTQLLIAGEALQGTKMRTQILYA